MECVKGDCYRVVSEQLPWSQANASCLKNGSHLAFAVNFAAIGSLLTQYGIQRAWIGATQTVGNWTWQDGSETSYTDWLYHSSKDYCAALGRSNPLTGAYGWTPDKCHEKKGYLCQIPNQSRQTCPSQMMELGFVDPCYFFNNTNNFSWFSARDECRKAGGNLARFSSEGQWKPIAERYKNDSKARRKAVKAWIGLSRISWHWTSGERLTANLWNHDAPGRAGNCLVVNNDISISRYRWKDWDCAKPLPYVCQTAYAPRNNTAGYKTSQSNGNQPNSTMPMHAGRAGVYIGAGVGAAVLLLMMAVGIVLIVAFLRKRKAERAPSMKNSRCDVVMQGGQFVVAPMLNNGAAALKTPTARSQKGHTDMKGLYALPNKEKKTADNVYYSEACDYYGDNKAETDNGGLKYSQAYGHRNYPDRKNVYCEPYGHTTHLGSLTNGQESSQGITLESDTIDINSEAREYATIDDEVRQSLEDNRINEIMSDNNDTPTKVNEMQDAESRANAAKTKDTDTLYENVTLPLEDDSGEDFTLVANTVYEAGSN